MIRMSYGVTYTQSEIADPNYGAPRLNDSCPCVISFLQVMVPASNQAVNEKMNHFYDFNFNLASHNKIEFRVYNRVRTIICNMQ
jgi:hypothetical protein